MRSQALAMWTLAGILAGSVVASAQDKPSSGSDQKQMPENESSSHSRGKDKGKSGEPKTSQPTASVAPTAYVIGPDDQLMISVWHEPELTMSVVVRPDGKITMPLLNDVQAGGLKPVELQSQLTDKLKPFINEPQVTVVVQAIRSRKVFLAGQVLKAGVYPLTGKMTVLELLLQAGGLGPFAKSGSIYILRTENGNQVRIPFNYKRAITGRSSNEDVELQPGDVVVVP